MLVSCVFLYVFFRIRCHFCRANVRLFWHVCFPVVVAGLWVFLRLLFNLWSFRITMNDYQSLYTFGLVFVYWFFFFFVWFVDVLIVFPVPYATMLTQI